MIADEYQVRLLRKSADRIMLVIPDVPESPARLRLQDIAHDLRREAHELEDAINARTHQAHADHVVACVKDYLSEFPASTPTS